MKITTKTNGYTGEKFAEIKEIFNTAATKLFGDEIEEIEHFHYGDSLDMIRIRLTDRDYGDFNLTANRVSFSGHECTNDQFTKFIKLTFNDECYRGQLMNI